MIETGEKPGTWRDYQKRLHKGARKKYYLGRLPVLGLYGGACFLVLAIIIYPGTWIFAHLEQTTQRPLEKGEKSAQSPQRLTREEFPLLFRDLDPGLPPAAEGYSLEYRGTKFEVKTSIDPSLQKYISHLLDRSMTYQAAVVVLRPDNGQILAMVNYENHGKGERGNLCLKADFPAASLFKVVA
ncbi:MAG: hypothetical protein MUO52_06370, partial [Desulfobacterales bacterium]|nr:hypothetical protein [Desulfobacterales bacterium]